MTTAARRGVALTVVTLIATLTGCVNPPTAELPSGELPEASAAPSVEADPPAYPVYDIPCEELVPPELITTLWGAEFVATPAQTWALGEFGRIPYEYVARQAGGTLCNWELAETDANFGGANFIRELTLSIAPYGSEKIPAYLERYYPDESDSLATCDRFGAVCTYLWAVGDVALLLTVEGITAAELDSAQDALSALVDDISELVRTATLREAWTAPEESLMVPPCSELITGTQLNEILGITKEIEVIAHDRGPTVSNPLPSQQLVRCRASVGADSAAPRFTFLSVTGLTGARWAFNDAQDFTRRDGAANPLVIEGLDDPDLAQIACAEGLKADQVCTVDIVVDHSWIELRLQRSYEDDRPPLYTETTEDVATKIAAQIVKNLRA